MPTSAQRAQFLVDAGIPADSVNSTAKELSERAAALSWARASLAANTDPDSWSSTLPANLLSILAGLYHLPPHRGPSPAPSDLHRLSTMIRMFDPNGAPAPVSHPPTAAGPGSCIDITRPPDEAPPAPSSPLGSLSSAQTPLGTPARAGGSKRMMHEELSALLPSAVYHALDASSGMSSEKRAKFHDACRRTTLATVLDCTTSPPFGHLAVLSLSEGSYFDPIKRGLTLALAARSATLHSATADLGQAVTRDAQLVLLRNTWNAMLPALSSPAELSSTQVNHLWSGVTFVMTVRAARSSTWGVPEVETACRQQLADLPAYRTAIATVVSRMATAYDAPAAGRAVNRVYLLFFLPLWWEHILERGILEPDKLEKKADEILLPRPTPPALPAPPAPPALPPPPPFYLPYPTPAPWVPPAPAPVTMPPQPLATPPPLPGPTPPPPAPGAPQPNKVGFCGKPYSPLICGNNHGLTAPLSCRLCSCAISRAYPGRIHYPFECPIRLHTQRGSCPGWTAAGLRIPASWAGDDITPACQAEWRTFAATLEPARVVGSNEVRF